jgi:ParB-like chromosome segregation protein Spo0J
MIEQLDPFVLIPTHRLTMSPTAYKRFRQQVQAAGRILRPIAFVEHLGGKYIVDGHHRTRAAKELRFRSIPAIRVTLPHLGYQDVADLLTGG